MPSKCDVNIYDAPVLLSDSVLKVIIQTNQAYYNTTVYVEINYIKQIGENLERINTEMTCFMAMFLLCQLFSVILMCSFFCEREHRVSL